MGCLRVLRIDARGPYREAVETHHPHGCHDADRRLPLERSSARYTRMLSLLDQPIENLHYAWKHVPELRLISALHLRNLHSLVRGQRRIAVLAGRLGTEELG